MSFFRKLNLGPMWLAAKQKIQYAWQQRQKREKLILLVGAIFLIVLGLDFGIWQPFNNYQTRLIQQYSNFQDNLPYIARTLMTYEQLKRNNQLPQMQGRMSLQMQLTNMLAEQQLVPFGVKTVAQNPRLISITFKQLPFDALMQGVESLNKQGVFVVQAQIKPVNHKGIVQGQVTFAQYQ